MFFKEHILLQNENVIEAAVVGISMESFGEVPRAFVVLKVHGREKELTDELLKFVQCEFFWMITKSLLLK